MSMGLIGDLGVFLEQWQSLPEMENCDRVRSLMLEVHQDYLFLEDPGVQEKTKTAFFNGSVENWHQF